jgi:hypothetical protein
MAQTGKSDFEFDTPGVVPLLCNVHPEMSGYIIVTPTSYFAETGDSGNLKIANVPRRQLHRDGLARRIQKPVETSDSGGRCDGRFCVDQVKTNQTVPT